MSIARAEFIEVMGELASLGICLLDFSYSGHNDEVYINEISIISGPPKASLSRHQVNIIERYLYDCVLPSGFGNDAGSEGGGSIEVPSGTVVIEHAERVIKLEWETIRVEV